MTEKFFPLILPLCIYKVHTLLLIFHAKFYDYKREHLCLMMIFDISYGYFEKKKRDSFYLKSAGVYLALCPIIVYTIGRILNFFQNCFLPKRLER